MMDKREALRELWAVILDTAQAGDPLGHLVAWWEVVTGRVTPDTPAGRLTPAGEAALAGMETEGAAYDLLAQV